MIDEALPVDRAALSQVNPEADEAEHRSESESLEEGCLTPPIRVPPAEPRDYSEQKKDDDDGESAARAKSHPVARTLHLLLVFEIVVTLVALSAAIAFVGLDSPAAAPVFGFASGVETSACLVVLFYYWRPRG